MEGRAQFIWHLKESEAHKISHSGSLHCHFSGYCGGVYKGQKRVGELAGGVNTEGGSC